MDGFGCANAFLVCDMARTNNVCTIVGNRTDVCVKCAKCAKLRVCFFLFEKKAISFCYYSFSSVLILMIFISRIIHIEAIEHDMTAYGLVCFSEDTKITVKNAICTIECLKLHMLSIFILFELILKWALYTQIRSNL